MRRLPPVAAILLAGMLVAAARSPEPVVHIHVDASAPGYPISPLIYGVSFGSAQVLRDLNVPLNRAGGNSASLYNWRIDARNAGADYFFESLPVRDPVRDQFGRGFMALSRAGGAQAMLTVPLIGWTAKLGPGRTPLAGFSVAKYGPQRATDRWMPDAGDGIDKENKSIRENDPRDAATPTTIAEQQAWVRALVDEWGTATRGGVTYYLLDNEPSLWHLTHRAVRPVGAHASEIADSVIAASAMVKAVDPTARIVAPEEWGWGGYHDSGFDQQLKATGGAMAQSDRRTQTGGMAYLPWLLTRWKQAGWPVDVVSVHFYPQGGEYGGDQGAGSMEIQRLRNRSTRLLWDRAYHEESWIAQPVALIPLLRQWVDRFYRAGTPIAITEYNWGGEDSMSGAVAQADIWGILGRERLDIANRWPAPASGTPTYLAMRMIRNYDGQGGAFGDRSLPTTVPDSDRVSTYSARRSADGALTLLIVNKQVDRAAQVAVDLTEALAHKRLRTMRLVNRKLAALPAQAFAGRRIATRLPPQSVTMLVLEDAR